MIKKNVYLLIVFTFLFLIMHKIADARYRIAVVTKSDIIPYQNVLKEFKKVCQEHYTFYYLNEKSEEEIIVSLKETKPNLILSIGNSALEILKDNIDSIPVVYCMVLNPCSILGCENINNITGVAMNVSPKQQFLILKEIYPKIKKIGVIYDPDNTQCLISEAEKICSDLGLELIVKSINSKTEIINEIKEFENKIEAFWMLPDNTVVNSVTVKYLWLFSYKNKVPIIGISDKYVKDGALFALSFDIEDIGRQTADMVYQILKKEYDKKTSFVFCRSVNLVVNVKTAKLMGIDLPKELL